MSKQEAKIKERPILFNSVMVRAILDGRKTQTRRAINPQPELTSESGFKWKGMLYGQNSDFEGTCRNFSKNACPFGKVGDLIWVKETYRVSSAHDSLRPSKIPNETKVEYATELNRLTGKIRPSIFMPRWASRILLEITNVRVERLNDISEEDAIAEGCSVSGWTPSYSNPDNATGEQCSSAKENYAELWESINGPRSWDINPWVWVIEFKRIGE